MVPGKNFRDPYAAIYARANIPREVVMTVPSFSAAAEVVAASDLVTMLPSSLLAAKGGSLGLGALVTSLPRHTTKFAMSWHERTHSDPAARAFRTLVRSILTDKRTKFTRPLASR
jgi:DNA-binding transcriptional LysR family regulator